MNDEILELRLEINNLRAALKEIVWIYRTIYERIDSLTKWLNENGPDCSRVQAHLDQGSTERLYWHYGYLIALRDVIECLKGQAKTLEKLRKKAKKSITKRFAQVVLEDDVYFEVQEKKHKLKLVK